MQTDTQIDTYTHSFLLTVFEPWHIIPHYRFREHPASSRPMTHQAPYFMFHIAYHSLRLVHLASQPVKSHEEKHSSLEVLPCSNTRSFAHPHVISVCYFFFSNQRVWHQDVWFKAWDPTCALGDIFEGEYCQWIISSVSHKASEDFECKVTWTSFMLLLSFFCHYEPINYTLYEKI